MTVELGASAYPVWIGEGVESRLMDWAAGRRGVVVTDSTVGPLYGERFQKALGGGDWRMVVIPAGEGSKSVACWATVVEQMAAAGLQRDEAVVALGGGVVGDVAGFAAATYMRGVPFVQVPTTLLAMVDSSVGGKTGLNIAAGKNLVGAFHQPSAVFMCPSLLNTLPEREYASGLVEVVKMAVALDADFFTWLEANANAIRGREPDAQAEMIATCCRLKAAVVQEDEKDRGRRALLNFGHTFGHAVEAASGYSLTHGEAVLQGMIVAMSFSIEDAGFTPEECARVLRLLGDLGALRHMDLKISDSVKEAAFAAMIHDKKCKDGALRMVLCERIGKCVWPVIIPAEFLEVEDMETGEE